MNKEVSPISPLTFTDRRYHWLSSALNWSPLCSLEHNTSEVPWGKLFLGAPRNVKLISVPRNLGNASYRTDLKQRKQNCSAVKTRTGLTGILLIETEPMHIDRPTSLIIVRSHAYAWRIPRVKIETRHPVEGSLGSEFSSICNHYILRES